SDKNVSRETLLTDCGLKSVKSHVQNIMLQIPLFSRRVFLGQALASVLPISARAEAAAPQDGFRVLEARQGSLQLLPEPSVKTAVWGYNGEVPGPLLRYKKGEEVK